MGTSAIAAVAACASACAAAGSTFTAITARKDARESSHRAIEASRDAQAILTFQRLHEQLVAPEAARGRKLLRKTNPANYPSPDDDDWDTINYTLALFDTLGSYFRRGEVYQDDVIASWKGPLSRLHPHYEDFIEHRKSHHIDDRWRSLDLLMKGALEATSSPSCPRCVESCGEILQRRTSSPSSVNKEASSHAI